MQIIKEITIDLNKATSYSIAFSVRQGDKDGRYIKAYLTADKVPFDIPETFTAVVKGMIDDVVVADDEICTIDRTTDGKHFVLIPLTELMCAGYGNLELTLKLKEGEAVASAQSIWITVERDKTANAKENYAAPINEVNAVLDEVITIEDETTTGLKRKKLNTLIPSLNETAEVLAEKGVDLPEKFGFNDVPTAAKSIENPTIYKQQAEKYKKQAEEATARAETEKKRANEAEARAIASEVDFKGMIERSSTEIAIPNGITVIGERTFYGYKSLESVAFSEDIETINDYAFYNAGLKNVTSPKTLTYIGTAAFSNCGQMETAVLNASFMQLDNGCFAHCTRLREIYLSNTIRSIYANVFNGCTSLEFVTLETGFNCSLDISASTLYSVETLVAMLEALADRTGQTAYTLTIGAVNLAKLTEEQIAIATNKNWTLA